MASGSATTGDCVLVTGGAGFIGSNFVLSTLARTSARIVTLDHLTYAGNLDNLAAVATDPRHTFVHGDMGDRAAVTALLQEHHPVAIVNFAAESHVDRSIDDPSCFARTNVLGTCELLEATRRYWSGLGEAAKRDFRFLHVSTDEVYGSLGAEGLFTENTPYAPNSPYAASKAASDHFVRAYFETFGLPVVTTNCSNNYGPRQFPEKLIPVVILNALEQKALPVYGDGGNVRDWLHVDDHCEAVRLALQRGRPGRTYNVGGSNEVTNLELVRRICGVLDQCAPRSAGPYEKLITFVKDRPGHDRRYGIDAARIRDELGWHPRHSLDSGLRETVAWYLENRGWCSRVAARGHERGRLGLGADGAVKPSVS